MKKNPFYLKEIPVDAPFCDREKEPADLISYAKSNTNVVLFSPRRYGKTSLIKRVQSSLKSYGTLTAYCDLFGVTSVEEIAERIAKSIYTVAQKNEGLFQKATDSEMLKNGVLLRYKVDKLVGVTILEALKRG